MEVNEKISVIIPTYNRGNVLLKSVESVLNQTYDNIELIIVDDGSTDNTKDIVKKLQLEDKRIKYVSYKKNKGACHARNVGIKKATGKYIAFQDSDDVFMCDKLEKQYTNMLNNKSDMDFCKVRINIGDFNVTFPNDNTVKKIKLKKYVDELCNGNYISTQSILIKKEVINQYLFDENLKRFQDYDLVLRMVPNISVSFTNCILVDLFRSDDSISNSVEKLYDAVIKMIDKHYKLNKTQKENLIKFLITFYSGEVCQHNNRETINKYNNLLNEYNVINDKYHKIINSKIWKCTHILFKK